MKVSFANVLMKHNADDYPEVRALAERARRRVHGRRHDHADDGWRPLDARPQHRSPRRSRRSSTTRRWSATSEEFCAPPAGPLDAEDALDTLPCSAGHTACYVSPYGDVYPCVQFPLPSGNVRTTRFLDIWRDSPQLNDVRSITMADLQGCSTCVHGSSCSRCPGLAYMEGNMRGPSIQDCEKSFARTGVPSWNLLQKRAADRGEGPVPGAASAPSAPRSVPVKWMART